MATLTDVTEPTKPLQFEAALRLTETLVNLGFGVTLNGRRVKIDRNDARWNPDQEAAAGDDALRHVRQWVNEVSLAIHTKDEKPVGSAALAQLLNVAGNYGAEVRSPRAYESGMIID
jgi:hypothetical protein